VGAIFLFIAMVEEPYHIDELRQVSSYDSNLIRVAKLSVGQEQPPLDAVLNAVAQRMIGVGDVQQRLLSVVFGVGSLAMIGALTLRSGLAWGSPLTVLVLSLSPLSAAVTAYARPYSLPLFLILALILWIDLWLERPRRLLGLLMLATALLLPLSRTIEPNLALAATIAVLLTGRYLLRTQPPGAIGVPVASAAAALAFVAVPTMLVLRANLEEYTASAPIWIKLERCVTDLPSVLVESFPLWPAFLASFVMAFAFSRSRRKLIGLWWFWVLAAVPVGFAVVFFLRTQPSQPYYLRYTFFWWPPVAVAMGALVAAGVDSFRDRNAERLDRRTVSVVATVAVITFLSVLGLGASLRADLSATGRPDWSAASVAIVESTSDSTLVIFEPVRAFDARRSRFWGQPRYLDSSRSVASGESLIRNPALVADSQPVALLLMGADPRLPGFLRVRADSHFTLYVPTGELTGPRGGALALSAAASAVAGDVGAHAALVAATLLARAGDPAGACDLVSSFGLLSGPNAATTRTLTTRAGEHGDWISGCSGEA
jgi:hypothetical protein